MWNQDDFGNEMAVVRGLQSFLHNVIAAASSAAGEFRIVEMDKETGVLVDGKRKGSKKLADAEAIRDFLPSEKSNYDSAFPDGFEKGAKRVSDLFGKKLVLAGVGGGVPKVKSGTELLDVEIDKPLGVWRTAAMIASEVEADVFAILTDMKPFFENPNGSDVCSMMELNVRDVRSFINDRSLGVLTDRFLAAVHYLDFYPKGLVLMSDLHDLPKIARGDFCSTVLVNR
jgi:hypothetical protein